MRSGPRKASLPTRGGCSAMPPRSAPGSAPSRRGGGGDSPPALQSDRRSPAATAPAQPQPWAMGPLGDSPLAVQPSTSVAFHQADSWCHTLEVCACLPACLGRQLGGQGAGGQASAYVSPASLAAGALEWLARPARAPPACTTPCFIRCHRLLAFLLVYFPCCCCCCCAAAAVLLSSLTLSSLCIAGRLPSGVVKQPESSSPRGGGRQQHKRWIARGAWGGSGPPAWGSCGLNVWAQRPVLWALSWQHREGQPPRRHSAPLRAAASPAQHPSWCCHSRTRLSWQPAGLTSASAPCPCVRQPAPHGTQLAAPAGAAAAAVALPLCCSQAWTKGSSSPSITPPTSLVSCPVRTSFTSLYGWKT